MTRGLLYEYLEGLIAMLFKFTMAHVLYALTGYLKVLVLQNSTMVQLNLGD